MILPHSQTIDSTNSSISLDILIRSVKSSYKVCSPQTVRITD